MEEALLIILGWSLGLFSSIIFDHIKTRSERRKYKIAVTAEFDDLKYRLCIVSFYLRQQLGNLDRDFVKWAKPIVTSYSGAEPNKEIKEFVEKLQTMDEKTFVRLTTSRMAESRFGSSLKTFIASYFESNVERIADLPAHLQTHCHEVRNHLNTLNQEILRLIDANKMTFDSSLSAENHDILVQDIGTRTLFIAGMCKRLADKIDNVLTGLATI